MKEKTFLNRYYRYNISFENVNKFFIKRIFIVFDLVLNVFRESFFLFAFTNIFGQISSYGNLFS